MKLYDVIRKEDLERGEPIREAEPLPKPPIIHHRPLSWKKVILIGSCIAFIVLIYILGMKAARATVHIAERHIPFSLQDTQLELVHETQATNTRLSFQTMVVEAEISREVYGSELSASTSKAHGKVIFFNEYSKTAQTIKAKTVITGKNGKKYVTDSSVTVPGYTLKGKTKSAGTSVPVAITASDVGPSYNTTGTSFTVAGRTATLYAQSAGEIVGGEDGMSHTVSSAEQPQVLATLQNQLTEKLKRETRAQIPPNLITFPDLQFVTVNTDSLQLRGNAIKFPAVIKGTMVTYLVSRDLMETAIAGKALSDRTYKDVSIPDLGGIKVVPVTAVPLDPRSVPDSLRISVSGDGTIITKVSVDTVRQQLVGIRKRNFSAALSDIAEIDTARYNFYPFWAPFFPIKESRLKIVIE